MGKSEVALKIVEELKFQLWGFSTVRMVLVLDALAFLYLIVICSPLVERRYYGVSLAATLFGPVGWLVVFALIFCFLPPFNQTKLYLCWPLTGAAIFVFVLLASL